MKKYAKKTITPKKIAMFLGNLLMLASIFFIIREVSSFGIDFSIFFHPPTLIASILFSLLFAGLVYIIAYSWKQILAFISQKNISFKSIRLLYVKSNLGKYLPGNIMHFVGRNLLGGSLGVGQAQIAFSTVFETLFIFLVALIWVLILSGKEFGSYIQQFLQGNIQPIFTVIGILSLAVIGAIFFLIDHKRSLIAKFVENTKIFKTKSFILLSFQLFFLYSLFFLIQGLMLTFIIGWSIDVSTSTTLLVISAFVLSWLLGFIIPGSPGGIGIREMVLLFMLSDVCGKEVILSAIIIHRLISILGEVLAYLFCIILTYTTTKHANPTHQTGTD